MPLDSTHTLHAWIKQWKRDKSVDHMPTDPAKHFLLGFPGVEAKEPKYYIRDLWLVAENDRTQYPKFTDSIVREFADHTNIVVRTLVKDDEKRHEELNSGAFLEADAIRILVDEKFGSRIWGKNEAESCLCNANNAHKSERPQWGVEIDEGVYEENDEKQIMLNVRYWMAARIQAKINAPCKEKALVPSATLPAVTEERSATPERQQESPPSRRDLSTEPSSDVESGPRSIEQHTALSVAMAGAELNEERNHSRHRARSNNSREPLSLTGSDSQASSSRSKRKRSVSRIDSPNCQPSPKHDVAPPVISDSRVHHTVAGNAGPPVNAGPRYGPSSRVTSADGASTSSEASTAITTPGVCEDKFDVELGKETLELRLGMVIRGTLTDDTWILDEVLPLTRELYAHNPHRQRRSDYYADFRCFNNAMEHWENLINGVASPVGSSKLPLDDPRRVLARQQSFDERIATFRSLGLVSQPHFTFDRWTIFLAMFFEGLLGDTYMPFSFGGMVDGLRAANEARFQPHVAGERPEI